MTARWHEALDAQAGAFAWFDSERGRAYARGWAEGWGDDKDPGKVHGITGLPISEAGVDAYRAMSAILPDAILAADTLYVEPDMMTVAEAAVGGFEPEPLHPSDLPTKYGFLYLPRPTTIFDRHGKRISVRAYLWAEKPGFDAEGGDDLGIVFYLLHRIGDADDYSDKERQTIRGGGLSPDTLLLVHDFPWPYGRSIRADRPAHGTLGEASELLRVIWRLMQQTIGVTTRERAPRAVRRRVRPDLAENLITVIRLRRPRQDTDPDRSPIHVDWAQRWIVSGHWRWQPYPSLGGLRRQIWISPYVKGPEDKPLVVRKARVLDLAR